MIRNLEQLNISNSIFTISFLCGIVIVVKVQQSVWGCSEMRHAKNFVTWILVVNSTCIGARTQHLCDVADMFS